MGGWETPFVPSFLTNPNGVVINCKSAIPAEIPCMMMTDGMNTKTIFAFMYETEGRFAAQNCLRKANRGAITQNVRFTQNPLRTLRPYPVRICFL